MKKKPIQKPETDMKKDFPSLGFLVPALSEGKWITAIGAMKELRKEIEKKAPELIQENEDEYRIEDVTFQLLKRTSARIEAAGGFMETLTEFEAGVAEHLCSEIGKIISSDAFFMNDVFDEMEKDKARNAAAGEEAAE